MDDERMIATAVPLPTAGVDPCFAFTETGEAVLSLWIHCHPDAEWPWGGREPVVVAIPRDDLPPFLRSLVEASARIVQPPEDSL